MMAADAAWLANPAHTACFVEPRLSVRPCALPTSWESYWEWRGWRSHADKVLGPNRALHAPLWRQLSAMLTFPLTLAHVLSRRHRHRFAPSREDELDIVLLGARAEAVLPAPAWLELAHALPGVRQINLRMVGPSVDPKLEWAMGRVRASPHKGFYHELAERDGIETPDAFVLFHPGLAHPGWRGAWEPTVQRVLDAKRPALCTGFSEADSRRNIGFVTSMPGGGLALARSGSGAGAHSHPRLWRNPFASRKLGVERRASDSQLGVEHEVAVQSNHTFFLFGPRAG